MRALSSIYKGTTGYPENPCLYSIKYSTTHTDVSTSMLKHLTVPRLTTLQNFFRARSDDDTLGCYAWSQAVSAGLLPILGDFEVSLRNALHRSLSQQFGNVDSFDWMMPQPNPAHARNSAAPVLIPARHKLNAKSAQDVLGVIAKIKGKKHRNYVVSPDDVVAALPFGFWEVLIGGLSHSAQPLGLQATILAAVFPNAPNTTTVGYGDLAFRQQALNLLKRIRDVRNRIGHHDAIWATPEFDDRGALGFIPRRPRHTVNSLRLFADKICWFAGWIDPDIGAYLRNSDHWWSLQALLQQHAIATYRDLGGKTGAFRATLEATQIFAPTQRKRKKQRPRYRRYLLEKRYFF